MELPPAQVQRAIEDIALLRRVVEGEPPFEVARPVRESATANLLLQVAAMVVALGILIAELVTGHVSSWALLLSANDVELRLFSIVMIGLMLLVLVAALYFVVYRASRHCQKDFSTFVARNFSYLKHLSFLSDLLIKFGILSLLISIGQPKWVAPVLFVFIGDYLIQGRFFTLPLRLSILLGAGCFLAGAIQGFVGSSLLGWPLAGFTVVCGLSAGQLLLMRKSQTRHTDAAR